jgi:hypothetical protein
MDHSYSMLPLTFLDRTYTKEEQAKLIKAGFVWIARDCEWYNDKHKTEWTLYCLIQLDDTRVFMLHCPHIDEGGYRDGDEYEHFDDLDEALSYSEDFR